MYPRGRINNNCFAIIMPRPLASQNSLAERPAVQTSWCCWNSCRIRLEKSLIRFEFFLHLSSLNVFRPEMTANPDDEDETSSRITSKTVDLKETKADSKICFPCSKHSMCRRLLETRGESSARWLRHQMWRWISIEVWVSTTLCAQNLIRPRPAANNDPCDNDVLPFFYQ